MTALELVKEYEKGHYTLLEVVARLTENHRLADIRTLPSEWQERVLERLARAPTTDEEWAKAIYILSWCGSGEPPTQEQLRAKSRQAVESLRKELEEEQRRHKE